MHCDKLDSPKDIEASRTEVFIYPSLKQHEFQTYQNIPSLPVYPALLQTNKNCTSKTPLIPKAVKVKCAPAKTNWFGILLAFMSGVFFTLCSGTVKYLTDIDPMELLIFRSLFQVRTVLTRKID